MRPLDGSDEGWVWMGQSGSAVLDKYNVPNGKGLPRAVLYKPSNNCTAGKPLPLQESNRSNWSVLPRIWLHL